MATNQTLAAFIRQVSISCFKTVVSAVPGAVAFIKNSLNLIINTIRDHYEHTIAHTFLRPGEHYLSWLTLTFFVLYLIDPHVIMSKLDFFFFPFPFPLSSPFSFHPFLSPLSFSFSFPLFLSPFLSPFFFPLSLSLF